MWYWIVMILLIGGSIALLAKTYININNPEPEDDMPQKEEDADAGKLMTNMATAMSLMCSRYEEGRAEMRRSRKMPEREREKRDGSGKLYWRISTVGRNTHSYSTKT